MFCELCRCQLDQGLVVIRWFNYENGEKFSHKLCVKCDAWFYQKSIKEKDNK